MAKRKICVVTGTRAEYGLLKPIIKRIKQDTDLSLQLVVTGTHLLPEYGNTIDLIYQDGFTINAKVPVVIAGDNKEVLPHSIGHGIIGFSQVFEILKPDIVLVLGDRYEIFAAAVAASYSGKVLAHIHGGDKLRGGFDEYTRHAITKISHIHFAATEKSAERIIKLGEIPENVFVVGSPSIETIKSTDFLSKDDLCEKLDLDNNLGIMLFVLHPISTSPESAAKEIDIVLDSIIDFNFQIVLIYPNVDPGSKQIINAIEGYSYKYPEKIKIFKNLPHKDYLNVMKIADIMIGNSSSGIIESSAFKIPVINIGHRQEGRESSENVINVNYSKEDILKSIEKCLYDEEFMNKVNNCLNPYGEGNTSIIISNVLKELNIEPNLFSKNITYP
ncbi:UDP-N-acetylglucosamine 2-epimerase [Methanoplanus endosymbiosus]|uniref:UDP-N-acetylglucosamine 2-epimerase n=1 Tax=Methanoplanus endosymbiosus TaxID=33865 RepID=A0A9E7PRJ4_9EURY|nr:UDP-N-acetylglucosamine 2-epimerase [Methanoplanus endosymbiosus]UUX92257.1 UDP-N-acetylglucosamine 2-epimerase [Methanoplanus endosymbiosus]